MDLIDLIAASKAGDAEAFTELVRRYQAMAFGSAYAALGDFHLAEDAAQQAFITAYRALDRLEQPERFAGWLRGIVRFECAHLRRGRRVPQVPLEAAFGLAAAGPGPAQLAEERDALDRLLAEISALPPPEREATVLFYVQERSQREVADFLGVPVSTVNNRLRAARKRLKTGGLLDMADDAFKRHALPADFAERVGEVVRAQDVVIDARFPPDRLPPVLNTLSIDGGSHGPTVTAGVTQHLAGDLVRCVASASGSQGPIAVRPGARVVDAAAPVRVPLDAASVARLIASLRRPSGATGPLATGIKVIDLLCPLPASGRVGLVGDMQTGKMVLVEELIHRLAGVADTLSLLVFVETPAEVTAIQGLDYRTSATVEAIYLPVADAGPEALAEVTAELDAVISFSRRLAKNNLYPAIDPLRSASRLLEPAVVGQEAYEVALEVRRLLDQAVRLEGDGGSPRDEALLHRAARVQRFLTQPFYVAEAFTNRPGRTVPLEAAVAGCRALLDGAHDDLPGDALTMIGALEEAIEAA